MPIPIMYNQLAENRYHGPVAQAVDFIVGDIQRKRQNEREETMRREYWNKIDERQKNENVFNSLFSIMRDPDNSFTPESKLEAQKNLMQSLMSGNLNPQALDMLKQRPAVEKEMQGEERMYKVIPAMHALNIVPRNKSELTYKEWEKAQDDLRMWANKQKGSGGSGDPLKRNPYYKDIMQIRNEIKQARGKGKVVTGYNEYGEAQYSTVDAVKVSKMERQLEDIEDKIEDGTALSSAEKKWLNEVISKGVFYQMQTGSEPAKIEDNKVKPTVKW